MAGTEMVRVDTGEAVSAQPFSMRDYLQSISTDGAIASQKALMAAYDRAVDALIGPGDVQDAERGKSFKKKSAWCKLARHFGISTTIKDRRTYVDTDGHFVAEVIVMAIAPWGQSTDGLGACSTREKRFGSDTAKAKADHDCLATAATRARNRAIADLIAQGEVSAEEMEHGGNQGAPRQSGEKTMPFGKHKGKKLADVPIPDLEATVAWCRQKDAQKFADLIDACQSIIAASGVNEPPDDLPFDG